MKSHRPKPTTKPFLCSAAAQQAGEDLSATAGHYQTYILIECPTPWAAKVFNSPSIPPALRHYIDAAKANKSVRFLGINREVSNTTHTTLLIYERTARSLNLLAADNFTSGYQGYEFHLSSLDRVVPFLEAYWQGQPSQKTDLKKSAQRIEQQNILVCTHGMRDKCCAKLGQPVYREAKHMADKGTLPNVRIWKASHIGGHRFAPTAITLPDGRYYGRLSLSALQAIVTRQGAIDQLRPVYRGWGLLPQPLQILEQQLLLSHGWSWLDNSMAYQTSDEDANSDEITAQISVQNASEQVVRYRARIVRDAEKTYCGKISCRDNEPSTIVKYAVADYSVEEDFMTADL